MVLHVTRYLNFPPTRNEGYLGTVCTLCLDRCRVVCDAARVGAPVAGSVFDSVFGSVVCVYVLADTLDAC
jgi:hypothetical protein